MDCPDTTENVSYILIVGPVPQQLTKSSAVAMVDRPYRLYPKASVRLSVAERQRFSRVTIVTCMPLWRCYIERCS